MSADKSVLARNMKLVNFPHRAMETPEAVLVCAGPAGDAGAGENGPAYYAATEQLKRSVEKVVERQRYIIDSVAGFGFKTVAP